MFDQIENLGDILTDLMRHLTNLSRITDGSSDLIHFLGYAAQLMYICRTIFAHRCSCRSIDTEYFLKCQSIIDILHTTEFILRYLQQNHHTDQNMLLNIFEQLAELFKSFDQHSSSFSTISRSLFSILQNFNSFQMSSDD